MSPSIKITITVQPISGGTIQKPYDFCTSLKSEELLPSNAALVDPKNGLQYFTITFADSVSGLPVVPLITATSNDPIYVGSRWFTTLARKGPGLTRCV